MKYSREDNQTNKVLHLLITALGIGLIYWGLFESPLLFNIITFPTGLILLIAGYKNYRKTAYEIQDLEFIDNKLKIKLLNGTEKEVNQQDLKYSLLVKKYQNPIRSIEFIEKSRVSLLRGKSLGVINVSKWEKDIEPIAKHLIKNEFKREKWKFGWSLGDFLMIFAILLDLTDSDVENYIEDQGSHANADLSEAVDELADMVSDREEKSKKESAQLEKEYLAQNKDDN